MADFGFSLIVGTCRTNLHAPLPLRSVHLKRPCPSDRSSYERFFECEVVFEAENDSFVLPWTVVNRTLPTGNAVFTQFFDDILVSELARLSGCQVVRFGLGNVGVLTRALRKVRDTKNPLKASENGNHTTAKYP
ncbi:AraC family transcriptional regulator ligand-binding domain-containing protein [Pseudomonas sp. OV226]|uniref:AraC family transcriptional regulator ligand-binding domain-containing protein n=1 Tax=Pseudomonas sp. OV226 TaxID=2135588 RepID=UPI000D6B3924